jgi:hypothetical protein
VPGQPLSAYQWRVHHADVTGRARSTKMVR